MIDDKEDWGREEEIEEDHRKIKEMVPKKFLKWRKVFGKIESERMYYKWPLCQKNTQVHLE